MTMTTQNSPRSALAPFQKTKTIHPICVSGLGTFPTQIIQQLDYFLSEVYGDLAGHLPVGLRTFESAQATKDKSVSMPGASARPSPAGLVTSYHPFTVPELRAQAERYPATRTYADKAKQLGAAFDRTHAGCCQQPLLGAMIYSAHLAEAKTSLIDAIRRARNEERIAHCRNAGYRIIHDDQLENHQLLNSCGSTGNGAGPQDAALGKILAEEDGVTLSNHVYVFLPSCSLSSNTEQARQNAGKSLLEIFKAVENPRSIVIRGMDGQILRCSKPVYDSITLVSLSSEFLAASSRESLGCKIAMLLLTNFSTGLSSFAAEQLADSKSARNDLRDGLPLLRRIGFNRCFIDTQRNFQVAKEAALEFLGGSL